MSDTLRLFVPGKPEYVRAVRMAVSAVASGAGFDVEAVEDIKVAVSEACANVVCHGANPQHTGYEVSCVLFDDRLVIRVIDQAGGYDAGRYKEPEAGELREGGLGIFIIKALMDEVSIDSEIGKGTLIQMIKRHSIR
ncbi:MAG: ATP-binding protein [Clostridiales Family XIII bacterium]|jgi:serine/threonine-protein kinase RsbW|nr:ATP-binding protein [Clostridiales Family XIII bacterium]